MYTGPRIPDNREGQRATGERKKGSNDGFSGVEREIPGSEWGARSQPEALGPGPATAGLH